MSENFSSSRTQTWKIPLSSKNVSGRQSPDKMSAFSSLCRFHFLGGISILVVMGILWAGRPRTTRTPALEEEVLRRVEEAPGISTRAIARDISPSEWSVWRTFSSGKNYIPFMCNESSHCNLKIILDAWNLHAGTWTNRIRILRFHPPLFLQMKPFSVGKECSTNTICMSEAIPTQEVVNHVLSNNVFQ